MREKRKDVVCGVEFFEKPGDLELAYLDRVYYFCCDRCLNTFSLQPERFVPERGSEKHTSCKEN